MNNQPKKQHHVPKCYLQQFADNNGNVYYWKHKQEKSTIKQINISGICYIKDQFTIHDDYIKKINENDAYIVEKKAFEEVENKYPKIIQNIIAYQTTPKALTEDDMHIFLEMIISLKRRSPIMKKQVSEIYTRRMEEELKHNFSQFIFQNLPKEVIEMYGNEIEDEIRNKIKDESYTKDIANAALLNYRLEDINNHFYQYKKFILYASAESDEFITSNDPVIFITNKGLTKDTALGEKNWEIVYPISKKYLFLLSNNYIEENINARTTMYPLKIDTEIVNYINACIKECSDEIIAYSESALIHLK
ncbi:MAG: DUF4238 domain-containing protein [Limnohabitans sp.]|nr:DUF4238 domain-containing protein [Limnohabitans sp.]